MTNVVQIKILDPRAAVPVTGTSMSAGYDLIACIDEPIKIKHGEKAVLIPTGLAIFIDNASVAGIILPRSGLGHKQGLVLGNTLGLIDGDYQNQWFVSVWNRGNGANPFGLYPDITISPGDRIAQAIFVPVIHPLFVQVNGFSLTTERGLGGFGSTDGFRNLKAQSEQQNCSAILDTSNNSATH